jgi:hypothetical protein
MKMKYIISEDGIPMVFSELQQHSEVARAMFNKVVGAGFCFIAEDRMFTCYGESYSLKITSRGEVDSSILNRVFGLKD